MDFGVRITYGGRTSLGENLTVRGKLSRHDVLSLLRMVLLLHYGYSLVATVLIEHT